MREGGQTELLSIRRIPVGAPFVRRVLPYVGSSRVDPPATPFRLINNPNYLAVDASEEVVEVFHIEGAVCAQTRPCEHDPRAVCTRVHQVPLEGIRIQPDICGLGR